LPVEPGQMKTTWSIVGIATTTTTSPPLSRFYPVLPSCQRMMDSPPASPPPPSLLLAQSFVFFFFAIRSFEKFRGCTHTNMHVLIHVLCVWPSLSTRWKWGLARSNLNLVFIFSPLSWVSQGREREGREEGDLEFAISITWRASRILANEKEISPTDSSHSDYSVVFSPLTLTGVVLSRWTRQNDDRCRLSIDFATQFSLVICSSS
jgi:hypothetical protein